MPRKLANENQAEYVVRKFQWNKKSIQAIRFSCNQKFNNLRKYIGEKMEKPYIDYAVISYEKLIEILKTQFFRHINLNYYTIWLRLT